MEEEKLEKNIIIYWWNFNKKTLDFKGTYKDYFKKRGIKVRIKENQEKYEQKVNILNFTIPLSSSVIKLQSYSTLTDYDIIEKCDLAIILFLTALGDKTIFHTGHGKEYKINWR